MFLYYLFEIIIEFLILYAIFRLFATCSVNYWKICEKYQYFLCKSTIYIKFLTEKGTGLHTGSFQHNQFIFNSTNNLYIS